jgi:Ser/Thr protein kinase RdoA (MazF antagonist)
MTSFDTLPHERQLEILEEVASTATKLYDLPRDVSVSMVNLSENATYCVEAPESGDRWALRIYRDGYHSRNAIASELAWMQALRRDGVATTPIPLPGRNGDLIQEAGHATMRRPRHVVVFHWESGEEPSEDEDLTAKFEILGEITARMHEHSRQWRRPDGFERLVWDFETSIGDKPHWGRWRDGMGIDKAKEALFAETVAAIGRRLERFGKGPDRFGLVHCDMRLANLLIDGDEVKPIDFDDCGFSWYLYDAATTVSFFEHQPHVPELLEAWARGYRKRLDLPKEDEAEIPTFVMLRRLLLVAWIGSHAETELAKSMGVPYTEDTVALCEDYLRRFG